MFKDTYNNRKKGILNDKSINQSNRELMKEFLDKEEKITQMKNERGVIDEPNYKTLYFKIGRLKNLNNFFKNKVWKNLTEKDIKNLIEDLHKGKIKTTKKRERNSDRALYYQMLKGRLFKMIGKDVIAREFIEEFGLDRSSRDDKHNEVRFIEEEDFRKLVDCAITPEQRCLLWVAFDIGENIESLLRLEKRDFERQVNEFTKEPEYIVNLNHDLKRTRTARREITNYIETVKFLDIVLSNLKESDKVISNKYMKAVKLSDIYPKDRLFKFGHSMALSFLKRCVRLSGVRCKAEGQEVNWKDLRSSMACDLLKKGWTSDEINARLGHRPSSKMLDKYINYLTLNREKTKKKIYDGNLQDVEKKLKDTQLITEKQSEEIIELKKMMKWMKPLADKMYEKEYSEKELEDMRENTVDEEEDKIKFLDGQMVEIRNK